MLKFTVNDDVQFECPHFPPQLLSLSFEWLPLQQSFFSILEEVSFLQHDFSVLVPHAKELLGINKKPNNAITKM